MSMYSFYYDPSHFVVNLPKNVVFSYYGPSHLKDIKWILPYKIIISFYNPFYFVMWCVYASKVAIPTLVLKNGGKYEVSTNYREQEFLTFLLQVRLYYIAPNQLLAELFHCESKLSCEAKHVDDNTTRQFANFYLRIFYYNFLLH